MTVSDSADGCIELRLSLDYPEGWCDDYEWLNDLPDVDDLPEIPEETRYVVDGHKLSEPPAAPFLPIQVYHDDLSLHGENDDLAELGPYPVKFVVCLSWGLRERLLASRPSVRMPRARSALQSGRTARTARRRRSAARGSPSRLDDSDLSDRPRPVQGSSGLREYGTNESVSELVGSGADSLGRVDADRFDWGSARGPPSNPTKSSFHDGPRRRALASNHTKGTSNQVPTSNVSADLPLQREARRNELLSLAGAPRDLDPPVRLNGSIGRSALTVTSTARQALSEAENALGPVPLHGDSCMMDLLQLAADPYLSQPRLALDEDRALGDTGWKSRAVRRNSAVGSNDLVFRAASRGCSRFLPTRLDVYGEARSILERREKSAEWRRTVPEGKLHGLDGRRASDVRAQKALARKERLGRVESEAMTRAERLRREQGIREVLKNTRGWPERVIKWLVTFERLRGWYYLSDRELSQMKGVMSPPKVAEWRRRLEMTGEIPRVHKRLGRDGKTHPGRSAAVSPRPSVVLVPRPHMRPWFARDWTVSAGRDGHLYCPPERSPRRSLYVSQPGSDISGSGDIAA